MRNTISINALITIKVKFSSLMNNAFSFKNTNLFIHKAMNKHALYKKMEHNFFMAIIRHLFEYRIYINT